MLWAVVAVIDGEVVAERFAETGDGGGAAVRRDVVASVGRVQIVAARRRVERFAGRYVGCVEDNIGGYADRGPTVAVATGLTVD